MIFNLLLTNCLIARTSEYLHGYNAGITRARRLYYAGFTPFILKGGQVYHFGKKDFKLGVRGEGQDTSRHFEGI